MTLREPRQQTAGVETVPVPIMAPEPSDKAAWLAAIVDSSFDAIIGRTLDGRITSWNAAAERMYGYAAHEVIGGPVEVIVPPDRRDELREVYERLGRGERIEPFETERVTKDGRRLAVAISLSPIRNEAGSVIGISAIARDITERKKAERELEKSRQELADFVEKSVVGLHWVGPDGTILWANQAELDLLGYPREEYIGHDIAEFHVDREVIDDILARLRRNEALNNYEARLRCKDGGIRHVLISSNAYFENGEFRHTRCFTSDITERKQAEILIAGQKHALEMIAQGAPLENVLEELVRTIEAQSLHGALASILLMDGEAQRLRHGAAPNLPTAYNAAVDGIPIGADAGSCGTAAYRREAVIVTDIASDPLWRDYRDLALAHGLRACWSVPILARDDQVLGTFAMYYREPRRPSPQDLQFIGVLSRTAAIAIEAKRAAEALRESERHLRQVLDSLGAMVMVTTPDGRLTEVNRVALELAALNPQDVLGQPLEETWWWSYDPEVQAKLRRALEKGARGETSRYDVQLRTGPDRYITVDFMLTPLVDGQGRVTHLIPSAIDITRRKQAERQQKLLVQELNHRVKNTLAIAQSLATQTSSSSTSPEHFAEAFGGRLAALARAHTLLAEARWNGAGLHDLIRQQLGPCQAPDRANVLIHGEDVALEPSAALTLGLALHELSTNAAKYGALAGPSGCIEISSRVAAGAAGRHLSLTWCERAGSTIENPPRRGFGLSMIERSVAYQLKGRATLEFRPDGLHCRIEIPLTSDPARPESGEVA